MKRKKINNYIILTSLGFMLAIGVILLRFNDHAIELHVFFLISVFFIIVLIGCQVWISRTSVLRTEQEAKADEHTRLMLESTPMLCSLWDVKGRPIDCDGETLKLLGLSNKSDYIEHVFDLRPEYQPDGTNSRSQILEAIKEAIETGYKRLEWVIRSIAGEDIPVEATIVRVPWQDSFCVAIYARDLREEKAKEAALKESEKRLRLILDSMDAPCLFFDPDGNLLDCNQSAVSFFTCTSKQEFLNDFFYFSPEYQSDGKKSIDKAKKIIRETFASGRDTFLWDHIKKDGTPLTVEVSLKQVAWNDGYRVVAHLRDLSKLVETEDNLRRVMGISERSPNFVIFLGSGGNIEYMNPAVSEISGFSAEELQKNGLALMFSYDDYELLNRMYISEALKNRNHPVNFEMKVTTKDGAELDYYFSFYAVQLYDGRTGLGFLGRDITQLKSMQRDLEAAKEQAEKALASEKKFNIAKSDFLSRVSHELRTPLNAIIGVTDMAGKTDSKLEMNNCCDKIKEASAHLLWLVNDIVDITSYDTGVFEFNPRPFSFKKAINSVVESVNGRVLAKEQVFDINIEDSITDWLESDERRLKQILVNLLFNAVKFTRKKGKIQLSAKELSNDGNECVIRFEVTDNGQGIAPDMLEHLGEVFEQADNSISREHEGLGLGLSLTKCIVKMMNGAISVKSEQGKGSSFIVDVRLGIAGVEAKSRLYDTASEDTGSADLSGKRILIVDDVEINREILKAMLEETGAIIHQASTGDEAVRMFSQDKYHLVLMDLHMPLMDGFTATRNIRSSQHPWAKVVPVISVSAEGSGELRVKCLEAGINDHIAKPVETESLLRTISKWIFAAAA